MTKAKTWPKEVYEHKNEWLAISADEEHLVGWGKTPKEALEMAKEKGKKENEVIIFRSPDQLSGLIV